MGLFDSVGSLVTPDLTGATQSALQTGFNYAAPQLTAGLANVNQLYGAAIPYVQQGFASAVPTIQGAAAASAAPYQSIYGAGTQGINAYMAALGQGGPGGSGGAPNQFWNQFTASPTYQAPLQEAQQQIARTAAAGGSGGSGAALDAAAKQASGYASQNYNNYLNQLYQTTPWATTGAGGLANAAQYGGTGVANLQSGAATEVASLLGQQAQQGSPFYQQQANLGQWLGNQGVNTALQQAALNTSAGLGIFGGLTNLAGGIFSDPRLKREIEPIGELFDGTNVYKFKYLGDETPRIGLMADEVQARVPEAVIEHPSGYKMVDYGRATETAASIFDQFLKAA